jgi:hypothetical protein
MSTTLDIYLNGMTFVNTFVVPFTNVNCWWSQVAPLLVGEYVDTGTVVKPSLMSTRVCADPLTVIEFP